MDYTSNPGKNMHAGRTNFQLLERMYGNVDGTSDKEKLQEDLFDRRTEELQEDLFDPRMEELQEDRGQYSSDGLQWRILHRSAYAEHHESDLGNGRKIRRILLLA